MYVNPAQYRKMENMHIIFWLFKDISWCMIWKELGHSNGLSNADRCHCYCVENEKHEIRTGP
jgi:hypothetical protein